jgi:hypothetical protein
MTSWTRISKLLFWNSCVYSYVVWNSDSKVTVTGKAAAQLLPAQSCELSSRVFSAKACSLLSISNLGNRQDLVDSSLSRYREKYSTDVMVGVCQFLLSR